MDSSPIREVVVLRGRVQGVGFRDRVLQIARGHEVSGTVRNIAGRDALEIDVEGARDAVERFLTDVLANPPQFARVREVERKPAAPCGATGFRRITTTPDG
jgi:acylphosphatase